MRLRDGDSCAGQTGIAWGLGSPPPYLSDVFGAGEAASFWKRGSFRSGSNIGSSRSSAGVSGMPTANGPIHGIESSFCNATIARSGSPACAAHAGEEFERTRTIDRVFLDRERGHRLLDESQRGSLVTKTRIGQREIANKTHNFPAVL